MVQISTSTPFSVKIPRWSVFKLEDLCADGEGSGLLERCTWLRLSTSFGTRYRSGIACRAENPTGSHEDKLPQTSLIWNMLWIHSPIRLFEEWSPWFSRLGGGQWLTWISIIDRPVAVDSLCLICRSSTESYAAGGSNLVSFLEEKRWYRMARSFDNGDTQVGQGTLHHLPGAVVMKCHPFS